MVLVPSSNATKVDLSIPDVRPADFKGYPVCSSLMRAGLKQFSEYPESVKQHTDAESGVTSRKVQFPDPSTGFHSTVETFESANHPLRQQLTRYTERGKETIRHQKGHDAYRVTLETIATPEQPSKIMTRWTADPSSFIGQSVDESNRCAVVSGDEETGITITARSIPGVAPGDFAHPGIYCPDGLDREYDPWAFAGGIGSASTRISEAETA